jgi:hypothetical protein
MQRDAAVVLHVLSKVKRQAVNEGIIPYSPMSRSSVKLPSKRRRCVRLTNTPTPSLRSAS